MKEEISFSSDFIKISQTNFPQTINFRMERCGVIAVEKLSALGINDSIPSNLEKSLNIMLQDQIELGKTLIKEGHDHLFPHCLELGVHDEAKKMFFHQVYFIFSSNAMLLMNFFQVEVFRFFFIGFLYLYFFLQFIGFWVFWVNRFFHLGIWVFY